MSDQTILITGAAGFIGFHVARRLLAEGRHVLGLDNLNNYYDPALKGARLDVLLEHPQFGFVKMDLADRRSIGELFAKHRFPTVVHLAAQAGVRYSIDHPHAYADANIEGFLNVLEGCRRHDCRHLVYASSSSVYGANTKLPFSVKDVTDRPISLYAATKKANELMAHSYSHLYRLPTTGLRFFTVYGPWGRPDMAIFLFARSIVEAKPIRDCSGADLQCRQSPPRTAHACGRASGAGVGPRGGQGNAADAARRRYGNLRRCGRSDARCRLQAADVDR
jgi:UDP-glucuronate 4-epimerase